LNNVLVYEPICLMSEATEPEQELARLTTSVFTAYRNAEFDDCIRAAELLTSLGPTSPLSKIYTERCRQHMNKTLEHSEGQIIMTAK
jgi:hypothetical protein